MKQDQEKAAPAAVPAGFVLVPVEPTQAMLDAVVTSMDDHLLGAAAEQKYREDWDAMLAAAPAAPQQAQAAHVGDTKFEGWLSCFEPDRNQNRTQRYSKQDMRNAYWAGYCEQVAAPQPAQANNKWRELAMKFDGHRMAAMAHLRTLLAFPDAHAEVVRKFLAASPSEQAAQQPAQAVPPRFVSDQVGGEFDDMTAGQGYRKGWNDCRAAMLAAPQPALADKAPAPAPAPEPVAIPWTQIVQAIKAVDTEAARRGSMFPQTSDEQDDDRQAVRRVCGMVEWYANHGGSVAEKLTNWPRISAPAAAQASAPAQAAPQPEAQPASVPEGFVLVPVNLLNEARASIDDYRAGFDFGQYDRKVLGKLKAAMLAAAPAAPQPALADKATAPAPETDDKPKSTAYERDLELLIHDFVRCSLVGTPSEATLHQLDRLIELVTHPTINRNLKSMRRQVTNPLPPCPPFASRRPSGAEIEAHEVQAAAPAAPQPAQAEEAPAPGAANDLADQLCWWVNNTSGHPDELMTKAAAELRRQAEQIKELREALEKLKRSVNFRAALIVADADVMKVALADEQMWAAVDEASTALSNTKDQ